MTSLTETLPILDEAVPALPRKVEALAGEIDQFEKTAREALGRFEERHAQARTLFEQVHQALEALEEQATQERQQVEQATAALAASADEAAQAVESGAQELQTEDEAVTSAFAALASSLAQGGDRVDAAHDEARQALDASDEQARSSQPELDGAVAQMISAIDGVQHAVTEGQAEVVEAVNTLHTAMADLLEQAQTRLGQTLTRLEELRSDQEAAVQVALSELTAGRGRIEHELAGVIQGEIPQAVDHELQTVAGTLVEMGQQLAQLHAECQRQREDLEPPFDGVADMIPPLQSGADQVHQAADQLGIAWP